MRGVDLNQFDFDYDLTWAGFFMNARGKVYGRFGGRDGENAEEHLTLPGLKNAMRAALAAYRKDPDAAAERLNKAVARVEEYPAAARLKAGACIHCHQVYNFEHEALYDSGAWKKDRAWIYPPPANLGILLDKSRQNQVAQVEAGSAAERAGLRAGDLLVSVGGRPVASFADLQYSLHHAPASGMLPVTWERSGQSQSAALSLPQGWRKSDLSWRASMWSLPPAAAVHGKDLSPAEKEALGLSAKALAFRQGQFVPAPAARAGIKPNDIILGLDGQKMEMTMLQFNLHIRMNHEVGETVIYRVIRDGAELKIPMKLQRRNF